MRKDADSKGLLTIGDKDGRITSAGRFLRKYKLDEIPQLFNVLAGQMSIVGPRPEVRKYVELYSPEQKNVLKVKPGITDVASLEYFNENEILAKADVPEKAYIEKIMNHKIEMNLRYIQKRSFLGDLKIIVKTLFRIITA
jgi:lipopolysaccharide/colanic/teichoic acid biosynthesis glycosyltransferase